MSQRRSGAKKSRNIGKPAEPTKRKTRSGAKAAARKVLIPPGDAGVKVGRRSDEEDGGGVGEKECVWQYRVASEKCSMWIPKYS